MTDTDPLAVLVQRLQSQFHARRRTTLALTEPILAAVDAYLQATDMRVAHELATLHALEHPRLTLDPAAAAAELLRLVQLLPELSRQSSTATELRPPPSFLEPSIPAPAPLLLASGRPAPASARQAPARATAHLPTSDAAAPSPPLAEEPRPQLMLALGRGALVIVGGTPQPARLASLSKDMRDQTEWIDTTRQGTHAIGNLERRIRERRIAALLILEGLVQHRHSDPLISAARSVELPVAYGGRGGRASLATALDELNRLVAIRHGA